MFRGLYEPMSTKKFENFTQYASLYPEFRFTFIGDNGQGDVRAGELMKEALGKQVETIFIHQVQAIHRTPGYVNYASRERWESLGIHFFRTYPGAALQALRMGMIHVQGLRRIVLDACAYFADLKASGLMPLHVLDQRRSELNRDIEDAACYLRSELGINDPGFDVIPSDCIFHVGSCVETSWGVGVVSFFNARTGIYTVKLSDWTLATTGAVRVYLHGSDILWHTKGSVGDAVTTRFGTGILTEIRELNGIHVIKLTEWGHAASLLPLLPSLSGQSSLPAGTSRTSSSPYAFLQPADFEVIVAGVGEHVQTTWGMGIVIKYRPPNWTQESETNTQNGDAAAASSGFSSASSASGSKTTGAASFSSSASDSDVTAISSVSNVSASASGAKVAHASGTAPADAPFSESASSAIVSMAVPPVSSPVVSQLVQPCLTNVGIYVCQLAWHDNGGAVAYLNGRSIKKINAEASQRRCVVM